MFDELIEAIFNNNKNENENNNVSVNENENDSDNDNDDNDDDGDDDDDDDHDEKCYIIKQLNNYFKTIDETKSLKEQIEILKKRDFLDEYWHVGYDHDDKELNLRIFKAKATYILNDLDEQLFEKIFGHTFVALADKVINTTNKEENKIIIDDIKKIEIKFTKKMILVIL